MCWDFETETEFQEKLDWMTTFMKKDVWPLEVLVDEFDGDRFFRVVWSLQDEVKKRGLWATHLPPELGGQGWASSSSA
jgi:acyl-CoA dehydrogenase